MISYVAIKALHDVISFLVLVATVCMAKSYSDPFDECMTAC